MATTNDKRTRLTEYVLSYEDEHGDGEVIGSWPKRAEAERAFLFYADAPPDKAERIVLERCTERYVGGELQSRDYETVMERDV